MAACSRRLRQLQAVRCSQSKRSMISVIAESAILDWAFVVKVV